MAEYLRGVFDRLNVIALGFDDWNYRHLKPWLIKAGFPEEQLEAKFLPIRQNYKEMSPALRALESALLERKLCTTAIRCWRCARRMPWWFSDGKENRMLTKSKSHGRIDGMVALAMAHAVAGTYEAVPELVLAGVQAGGRFRCFRRCACIRAGRPRGQTWPLARASMRSRTRATARSAAWFSMWRLSLISSMMASASLSRMRRTA